MRKIVLSINITEDGFIAGPVGELDWHLPFWDLKMCEALCRLLTTADTILLGRKTYSALASYWTSIAINLTMAREDIVLAEMMNRLSKVVVSKTLESLPWINSSLIKENILTEIENLKHMQGKDIVVFGSCMLTTYLIKHNLIDEYNLWIHPITIKKGMRISKLPDHRTNSTPILSERFTTGVVKMSYKS